MASARTVLLSGGSRGLGAGLVERFLGAGDRVATFSRSGSERVTSWQASCGDRFRFREIDATDLEGLQTFVREVARELGPIEVLINNAGIALEGLLPLFPDADIDRLLQVNVAATIKLTRVVSRMMLLLERGRIINISSVVGLSGYRGLSVYGATKAALDGFTRGLARELGPKNITVNSIAPGYLRTEMTHGLSQEQTDQIIRRTPLGRLGEVGDVVELAYFLASPAGDFITGQIFVIDGGITC